ncbi:MAG: THUMP domain-containing protein [Desulfurococcales archaeon]|nr:THUMP domain-containing protein [Desulfurococcales archaeon]
MLGPRISKAVIVRYSEVAVKGWRTRKRMERLLVEAIRKALQKWRVGNGSIEIMPGRIVVWNPENVEQAALAVAHVFGVKSVSPAYASNFEDLEDIVSLGVSLYGDRVRGRIFRVRARRAGQHDFTSKDVERELGAALLSAGARGVDLEAPEYTVYVEVRDNTAFFYDNIIQGPGGLPLGSEEPVLVLFSGGFDSTAAAWLIMRRGAPVGLAFYDLGVPEAWRVAREAAEELAKKWVHWGRLTLYRIHFEEVLATLMRSVKGEYRLLVLRRLMLEHACNLAVKEGYEALATGESVGQVASQTVRNIRLIGSNTCLPVLRPVSGMDKDEVTSLTMRIGLYDIVSHQIEACRGNPVPRASIRIFYEELEKARRAVSAILDNIAVEREEIT